MVIKVATHLFQNIINHFLIGLSHDRVVLDGGLAELHSGRMDGDILVLGGPGQQHALEQVEV